MIADLEDLEKLDASKIFFSKNQRKRNIGQTKKYSQWQAGTAKLSGRDYEFRVPTPSREPTVRSEDLSGEIQGESAES